MSKCTSVIAEGVYAQTSDLWNTNSTVITGLGKGAKITLVVDPCWYPNEIAELQNAVSKTPMGLATHVVFTHSDFDHVVGWEDFPGAQIIAHPEAMKRDAAEIERQVADLDVRKGTVRPRPYRYPSPERFGALSVLDLGGEAALFFPAPGHTADGLFIVLPERHIMISGDYLSDEEFPFIYHSFSEYRATLLQARELCNRYSVTKVVPGHGQVAQTADEVEYRISTDLDYLERLASGVEAAKSEGLGVDAAVSRLSGFTFRGNPISGGQLGAHIDNIRLMYGETFRAWTPQP